MDENDSHTELPYSNRKVWLRAFTASLGYLFLDLYWGISHQAKNIWLLSLDGG